MTKGILSRKLEKKIAFLAISAWHICTTWSQWANGGPKMDITEWSRHFRKILNVAIKKCKTLLFDCWCWATWLWLKSCRKPTSDVGYIRDNSWFSRNIRWSQREKPLLFLLIVVGQGMTTRSFNCRSMIWYHSMISFFVYYYCLLYFDSLLLYFIRFNCKYPADNCMFGVGDGETLQ